MNADLSRTLVEKKMNWILTRYTWPSEIIFEISFNSDS